jgi:hypothetical protein
MPLAGEGHCSMPLWPPTLIERIIPESLIYQDREFWASDRRLGPWEIIGRPVREEVACIPQSQIRDRRTPESPPAILGSDPLRSQTTNSRDCKTV